MARSRCVLLALAAISLRFQLICVALNLTIIIKFISQRAIFSTRSFPQISDVLLAAHMVYR